MSIPDFLRSEVITRAGNRCEYCGLSQEGQEATFHIDHIQPVSLNGETHLDNLALACVSSPLRKGVSIGALDPETGLAVPLFHPRSDSWNLHYRWSGAELVGIDTDRTCHFISLGNQSPHRHQHPPTGTAARSSSAARASLKLNFFSAPCQMVVGRWLGSEHCIEANVALPESVSTHRPTAVLGGESLHRTGRSRND